MSYGLGGKTNAKHVAFTAIGLAQLWFCYGPEMKHPLFTSAVMYAALYFFPLKRLHYFGMIFPIAYLSFLHMYRQYYDYGGWRIDITS